MVTKQEGAEGQGPFFCRSVGEQQFNLPEPACSLQAASPSLAPFASRPAGPTDLARGNFQRRGFPGQHSGEFKSACLQVTQAGNRCPGQKRRFLMSRTRGGGEAPSALPALSHPARRPQGSRGRGRKSLAGVGKAAAAEQKGGEEAAGSGRRREGAEAPRRTGGIRGLPRPRKQPQPLPSGQEAMGGGQALPFGLTG